MIGWRYIDTNSAAVAAMRDYSNMKTIIDLTPEVIKDLYDKMISPRISNLTDMPKHRNMSGANDSLSASLDKLDVFQDRYRLAIEYMAWFEPAWNSLSDVERTILREFYMGDSIRSGANERLQSLLHYSRAQINRIRGKALTGFSLLLFGDRKAC